MSTRLKREAAEAAGVSVRVASCFAAHLAKDRRAFDLGFIHLNDDEILSLTRLQSTADPPVDESAEPDNWVCDRCNPPAEVKTRPGLWRLECPRHGEMRRLQPLSEILLLHGLRREFHREARFELEGLARSAVDAGAEHVAPVELNGPGDQWKLAIRVSTPRGQWCSLLWVTRSLVTDCPEAGAALVGFCRQAEAARFAREADGSQ